jgi:hypothetical protein
MKKISADKSEVPLFKKIMLRVRYGMTLQSLRSVLRKIGIEISPFYLFREGMYTEEIPQINGMTEYSVEFLEPSEMKFIKNIHGFSEERLLEFLKNDNKCIAIKHKGEIAAFMWINFKEIRYTTTVINLKSNEAYLWHMYTMESARGNNLAPYLRYRSYEILMDMNRDVLYSISDYFNSPAVRFKQKLDAKKLKVILFIQLFNKLRWTFTLKSYQSQ